MIVVSDSSALVVLFRIGHGDVLPTLFKQIVIPPEVACELAFPNWPQSVQDFIAAPPSWLEIRAATSVEPIPSLHAGEAAAISLAQEIQADRLIIDEKCGRKAATERHLPVIGTVGILEAAAERGLLDWEQAFEKVKLRTSGYVPSSSTSGSPCTAPVSLGGNRSGTVARHLNHEPIARCGQEPLGDLSGLVLRSDP